MSLIVMFCRSNQWTLFPENSFTFVLSVL